jgi:hypothetical protein
MRPAGKARWLKPVDLDTLCAAILTAAEPRAATVTAGGEGENQ